MAKRLYVGGLPYSSSEDQIREAFAQAGTVESVSIVTDKMSGRSRGFGFVEMSTDEEAQKAIEMWHDKEFDGRTLTVNEARPLSERPPRRDGGGGGGYGGNGGGRRDRGSRW
ncbi:MAG: RNA-binding protein [Candidatus Andersenbacteria bacterium]